MRALVIPPERDRRRLQVAYAIGLCERVALPAQQRGQSREIDRVGRSKRARQREGLAAAERAVFAQDSARARSGSFSTHLDRSASRARSGFPATMTTGNANSVARESLTVADIAMRCATLRSDAARGAVRSPPTVRRR